MLNLPAFQAAHFVLFYSSFKSEVDTRALMRSSFELGKRVAAPKVYGERNELLLYEILNMEDLVKGYLGIGEPIVSAETLRDVRDMDLIIVPGVAFDEQCSRLGYGKGFYDKLLRLKRSPAIALAYEEQIVEAIPSEPHDIRMDGIITDMRILRCRG